MLTVIILASVLVGSVSAGVGSAIHHRRYERDCRERARDEGLDRRAARRVCDRRQSPAPVKNDDPNGLDDWDLD